MFMRHKPCINTSVECLYEHYEVDQSPAFGDVVALELAHGHRKSLRPRGQRRQPPIPVRNHPGV
jgi:hypothetical protein